MLELHESVGDTKSGRSAAALTLRGASGTGGKVLPRLGWPASSSSPSSSFAAAAAEGAGAQPPRRWGGGTEEGGPTSLSSSLVGVDSTDENGDAESSPL